jgi:hypothetical protein
MQVGRILRTREQAGWDPEFLTSVILLSSKCPHCMHTVVWNYIKNINVNLMLLKESIYNPGQKCWDNQPFLPLNSKDNAPSPPQFNVESSYNFSLGCPQNQHWTGEGRGVRFKRIFCVKSAFSEENNKNMRKFWVVPRTFVQDCRNLDDKLIMKCGRKSLPFWH